MEGSGDVHRTTESENRPKKESADGEMSTELELAAERAKANGAEGEGPVRGIVKWFSFKLGYGFVIRDDGKGDVFVYQQTICKKGYRTLAQGEKVVMYVLDRNIPPEEQAGVHKGPEATIVMGHDGGDVVGCGKVGSRPAATRDRPAVRCYVCASVGHMASRCPNQPARCCHTCGEGGHVARTCPYVRTAPWPAAYAATAGGYMDQQHAVSSYTLQAGVMGEVDPSMPQPMPQALTNGGGSLLWSVSVPPQPLPVESAVDGLAYRQQLQPMPPMHPGQQQQQQHVTAVHYVPAPVMQHQQMLTAPIHHQQQPAYVQFGAPQVALPPPAMQPQQPQQLPAPMGQFHVMAPPMSHQVVTSVDGNPLPPPHQPPQGDGAMSFVPMHGMPSSVQHSQGHLPPQHHSQQPCPLPMNGMSMLAPMAMLPGPGISNVTDYMAM